jgi:hypothetical protein
MVVWRDRRAALVLALMSRRFPPPWSVEETDACFIVKDHAGHSLACLAGAAAALANRVVQPALQNLQHKLESRRRLRIAATGASADLEKSGL